MERVTVPLVGYYEVERLSRDDMCHTKDTRTLPLPYSQRYQIFHVGVRQILLWEVRTTRERRAHARVLGFDFALWNGT